LNGADKDTEMPDVAETPMSSAASPQKAPTRVVDDDYDYDF
jgi:hypothetical protein